MNREKIFFISFFILTFVIYGQSLFGDFVFDDRGIIEHQELLGSLDNILQVAVAPYWTIEAGLYRPTTLLSYLFNNIILGSDPIGFHLINLLLYFGIGISIYLLIKRLFKEEWLAYLAALLFLVLPIHTEVVANVTGRSELLSLFFSLFTLLEFTRTKPSPWRAGLWLFLAIGAKETAIATVPLVLLLLVIREREFSLQILQKYTYALLGAAAGVVSYFVMRLIVLGPSHFLGIETSLIENPIMFADTGGRVLTSLSILWMYVKKTFWPSNLCSDYSFNQIPVVTSFLNIEVILGALILLSSLIAIFVFIKTRPLISFAAAIFLFSFIPVSNIFFPIGTIAGERLFFFPSLGLVLVGALLLSKIKIRWLALTLIIPYLVIALNHQSVWLTEEKLFLNAAQCSPNSVLSLSNVGTVYYFRGDYVQAAKYLEKSREIMPIYSKGLNNLGLVYWKMGRNREAEYLYHEALKQRYPYAGAYENLVLLYLSEGDKESALRWLRVIYPNNEELIRSILNS